METRTYIPSDRYNHSGVQSTLPPPHIPPPAPRPPPMTNLEIPFSKFLSALMPNPQMRSLIRSATARIAPVASDAALRLLDQSRPEFFPPPPPPPEYEEDEDDEGSESKEEEPRRTEYLYIGSLLQHIAVEPQKLDKRLEARWDGVFKPVEPSGEAVAFGVLAPKKKEKPVVKKPSRYGRYGDSSEDEDEEDKEETPKYWKEGEHMAVWFCVRKHKPVVVEATSGELTPRAGSPARSLQTDAPDPSMIATEWAHNLLHPTSTIRTHVLGFEIDLNTESLRIHYLDASGPITSSSISLRRDFESFVTLIIALQCATDEMWGYVGERGEQGELVRLRTMGRDYKVGSLLPGSSTPQKRKWGFEAEDESLSKKNVMLELSWVQIAEDNDHEQEESLVRRAKQHGVIHGLPEITFSTGLVRLSSLLRGELSTSGSCRDQELRVRVLDSVLVPLWSVTKEDDFKAAFRGLVQGEFLVLPERVETVRLIRVKSIVSCLRKPRSSIAPSISRVSWSIALIHPEASY